MHVQLSMWNLFKLIINRRLIGQTLTGVQSGTANRPYFYTVLLKRMRNEKEAIQLKSEHRQR